MKDIIDERKKSREFEEDDLTRQYIPPRYLKNGNDMPKLNLQSKRMKLGRQISYSDEDESKIVKFKRKLPKLKRQQSKSDTEVEKLKDSDIETLQKLNEDIIATIKKIDDYEKKGKGLKILTPNQLLTRLPILLAQKKAGNNSQKLSNAIRQIIYSLYQSKNMSKSVYNNLINI